MSQTAELTARIQAAVDAAWATAVDAGEDPWPHVAINRHTLSAGLDGAELPVVRHHTRDDLSWTDEQWAGDTADVWTVGTGFVLPEIVARARRGGQQYVYHGPTIADALRGWVGIPHEARDIRISQTAPERHRARVLGTIRAAAEYLAGPETGADLAAICERRMLSGGDEGAQEWSDSEVTRRRVAAMIRLDLHGIGGHGGYSGGATARMPYAVQAGLGKARWQASDGGAWRGAAESAAELLAGGADVDVQTLRALWDDRAFDGSQWYVDAPWYSAYARHRMASLMAQYARTTSRPADAVVHGGVSVRSMLWEWDALLTLVESDVAAERGRDPATGELTSEMSPQDRRARLHLDLLRAGVRPETRGDDGGLMVAGFAMEPGDDGTVSLIDLVLDEYADGSLGAVGYYEAIERACAATALAA